MIPLSYYYDSYADEDVQKFIANVIDINQFKIFSGLDNNEARFRFMYNFRKSEGMEYNEFNFKEKKYNNKDETIALELKKKGNMEFQAKNWNKALEMYNQCYHATPTKNVKDISIILANRSAALYHMEMYDLAISDIELAMTNYPTELMYKIEERKAKCLLAKNDFPRALQHFQKTLHCLADSGLSDDKREKLEQGTQIQIQVILKDLKKSHKQTNISKNVLIEFENKNLLHESVGFDYNENDGRFAVAKNDIKIGEQILVQQAHCARLLEQYNKTHCQHCFQRTIAPLPCPSCSNVIFCSKNCRDIALGSYHKYECMILPIFWSQRVHPLCLLSLQMITQHDLDYFLNLKDELKNTITIEDTLKLPSNDYRKVYNLVRHEEKLDINQFFLLAAKSNWFFHYLKLSGYFQSDNEDEFFYIGGLILRNLQIVKFNTHSVDELKDLQDLKFIPIGDGIYPTLALFNHSCDPSIFRYFKGTTIIANSIKTTKAGDMIADNYGVEYTFHLIEKRNALLSTCFWFKCNCCACKENWPLAKQINRDIISINCAGKKPCTNVLHVLVDVASRKIKCNTCGQFTNILAEMLHAKKLRKSATKYFDDGEYGKAMSKYIELLTILESIIKPPFPTYIMLKEMMTKCLLLL